MLWAPIVDSVFWPKFGRRKSWLVPSQYLIGEGTCTVLYCTVLYCTVLYAGVTMVVVSCYVDTLLGEEPSLTPGTEPLPSNNQTLATGFSGGDTGQLVSRIYLYFFTVLYPHISTQPSSSPPNIAALTAIYFLLNLLAATQDVAVDG